MQLIRKYRLEVAIISIVAICLFFLYPFGTYTAWDGIDPVTGHGIGGKGYQFGNHIISDDTTAFMLICLVYLCLASGAAGLVSFLLKLFRSRRLRDG